MTTGSSSSRGTVVGIIRVAATVTIMTGFSDYPSETDELITAKEPGQAHQPVLDELSTATDAYPLQCTAVTMTCFRNSNKKTQFAYKTYVQFKISKN